MEEKNKHRSVWIVLAVIVGLLFVCGLSATVGGLAGYMAGKRAAASTGVIERRIEVVPQPWREQVPELPVPEITVVPIERWGALVGQVQPDSPADEAGLRVGDIILEMDGQPLAAESDLADLIAERDPGDEVTLRVRSRGRERVVTVTLGRHPQRGGETAYLGISYNMVPAPGVERR
jgi:membrane-associated protease RseP (regulator of RpoE activity)